MGVARISDAMLRRQLDHTLVESQLTSEAIVRRERGKVRDSYLLADGRRLIVTTDRISAFDQLLGTLPWKGQVLSQLCGFWFRAAADQVPTHFLSAPDPNLLVVRDCRPLPVEWVMRAYLTGVTSTSIWGAYARGERVFCGHRLPEGLRKYQALPEPLLTPSTKAEHGGHDESVAPAELLRRGLCTEALLREGTALCARLFAFGQEVALRRGLILVDTKYELGLADTPAGPQLMVIDEIHTPDSSRFWFAEDHEARMRRGDEPLSLDKEYVRQHLAGRGYTGAGDEPPPPLPEEVRVEAARRYITAYELLVGEPFVPDTQEPVGRLQRSVAALLHRSH